MNTLPMPYSDHVKALDSFQGHHAYSNPSKLPAWYMMQYYYVLHNDANFPEAVDHDAAASHLFQSTNEYFYLDPQGKKKTPREMSCCGWWLPECK